MLNVDIQEKYVKEQALRTYANEFWNEVKEVCWVKDDTLDYLPIVFTYDELYTKDGGIVCGTTYTHTNKVTRAAVIFPVISLNEKYCSQCDDESTIRHEIIHYFSGIKYKCSHDNNALFWLLCDCFDAGAYMQMNSKSRKIYDVAKPYIDRTYSMVKLKNTESAAIQFSLMLTSIDLAESSETPNYSMLEGQLRTVETALNTI